MANSVTDLLETFTLNISGARFWSRIEELQTFRTQDLSFPRTGTSQLVTWSTRHTVKSCDELTVVHVWWRCDELTVLFDLAFVTFKSFAIVGDFDIAHAAITRHVVHECATSRFVQVSTPTNNCHHYYPCFVMCSLVTSWLCDEMCVWRVDRWRVDRVTSWLVAPRTKGPYGELSFPRNESSMNFRSWDLSYPGTFVPIIL